MKPVLLLICCVIAVPSLAAEEGARAGASGRIGTLGEPKRVARLRITEPGVYENFLVDGRWARGNLVKVTSGDVVLRNCEIHSGAGNGIGVFASNVTVENCRIHHMLAGTFGKQQDAHGIAGHWGKVVIRNCEIHHTSGDSVQFDPDRVSNGELVIENCTFWTGPLPADAVGFRRGETPGENAFDSKTGPEGERRRLIIRDSYFHGWKQPGQIANMAALNLKEHIHATVSNCVFRDHEIALRLRGPGKRGGALVEIRECAIYDSGVGLRIEDGIENLRISGLAFGGKMDRKYHQVGGGAGPGFLNEDEQVAPPLPKRIMESPP